MNSLIHIPELYCPVESHLNPHILTADTHTNEWVKAFQLFSVEEEAEYKASKFTFMTARFYPTATYERLCLVNDLLVLLFTVDDAFDHQVEKSDIIKSAASIQHFMRQCLQVLENKEVYTLSNGGPILGALTNLWQRFKEISSNEWQETFLEDIRLLFDALIWQINNANLSLTPSVEEYIKIRPFLGGAHICATLIEVVEEVYLPYAVRFHESLKKLTELCGHLGCWQNDLFSLGKELMHGDADNLVLIIQHEKGITLEEAIFEVVEIHNKEMRQFIQLQQSLPLFTPNIDMSIKKYAFILGMILRGNIDWSVLDTARYEFIYGCSDSLLSQYGTIRPALYLKAAQE